MPIYQYQGKHYDLSETDPAAAKAKILNYLGSQEPAAPAAETAAPAAATPAAPAIAKPAAPIVPDTNTFAGLDVPVATPEAPSVMNVPAKTAGVPEDPMLNPRFITSVQAQLDSLPADQRAAALEKIKQSPDAYGRAARVIEQRYAKLNAAPETIQKATDTRLEAQRRRFIKQGLRPEFAESYAQTQALSGTVFPDLQQMEADVVGEKAAAEAQKRAEELENAGFWERVGAGAASQYAKSGLGLAQATADLLGDRETSVRLGNARRIEGAREQAIPEGNTIFERSAQHAMTSLAGQAPTIALSALTGTAGPVLAQAALQQFGDSYGEGRASGLSGAVAATRAVPMAAAEVFFERFGMTKALAGLKGFVAKNGVDGIPEYVAKSIASEIPSEMATTLTQYGIDALPGIGTQGNPSLVDLYKELEETLRQTVLQAGVTTATVSGGAKAAQTAAKLFESKGYKPDTSYQGMSRLMLERAGFARPEGEEAGPPLERKTVETPAPIPTVVGAQAAEQPAATAPAAVKEPEAVPGMVTTADLFAEPEAAPAAPTETPAAAALPTTPAAPPAIQQPAVQEPAAPQHEAQGLPIQEVPVQDLKLSKDVPQFKLGASEKGVVEPLGGKFERTGVAPIQVWRRLDGSLEVISGRHRLDLAQRSGETTIPAQIHDEAKGFDRVQAAILDAELNIRDGQGKVKDYVNYFKEAGIDRDTAESKGLLARATGKRSFTIANQGSDELIAAVRNDQIGDEAAYYVALNAPNDARLQSVGLKAIADGKSMNMAVNTMQAVKALAGESDTTTDMFDFDDSAMREADDMAKAASSKQREIQTRLSAISGAAKNPAIAKAEGIDVKDPDAIKRRIDELKQLKSAWDKWSTNPELIAEIREGRKPAVEEPQQVEEPAGPDMFASIRRPQPTAYDTEQKRSPSLKRILETLERRLDAGKITNEQFIAKVSEAVFTVHKATHTKPVKPRVRGADYIRQKLLEAKRRDELDAYGVDLAEWFIQQNPALLDDLGIGIRQPGQGSVAAGTYNPITRLVMLLKGRDTGDTVVHEILHHLERMMPANVQEAIRKEWLKQLVSAQKKAKIPADKLYFAMLMDAHLGKNDHRYLDIPEDAKAIFFDTLVSLPEGADKRSSLEIATGLLTNGYVSAEQNYQYFNPSEFWAVNGSRIVEGKYAAVHGNVLTRLKNWLGSFAQRIKGLFGMQSDAPILKALNSLSTADGQFVSDSMLQRGKKFLSLGDDERMLRKYNRPNTPQLDTSPMLTAITRAGRYSKDLFKDAVMHPVATAKDTMDQLLQGITYIRNKNVWFGSGLNAADFKQYNGALRTSEGFATASVALDNAIRGAQLATEVIFRGGIKYDPKTLTFNAVKTDKGMAGVYKAEIKLKKMLGDQVGTDLIQAYLEAKRSRSIQNELYKRTQQYDDLNAELAKLKAQASPDPKELKRVTTELEDAAEDLDAIKVANAKINMSDEEIADFIAREEVHPELREIMENWTAVNQNMLNFWRQVGLLSPGRYQVLSSIDDYVPWNRIMDDAADVHSPLQSTTRKMTNIGLEKLFKRGKPKVITDFVAEPGQKKFQIQPASVIKATINGKPVPADKMDITPTGEVTIHAPIKAGDLVVFNTNREIENVIDNMTRNVMRMTMNGLRQYAAMRIVKDYATREPNGNLMVVPKVDPAKGRFNFIANGKRIVVEIQDPLVAESIFGMETLGLKTIPILAAAANLTRRTITLSGAFQIKQVFKDAPTAAIVTGVKNPALLIGGVYKGFVTSLTKTDPVVDILHSAGIAGFRSPTRTPEAEIKQRLGIMNRNVASFVLRGLDHIGDASDMAQRVATYKRVLAETGDEAQALYQAANVINFNRHGSGQIAQFLVKTAPFMGAWANSTDVLFQALAGGGLKGISRSRALQRLAVTGTLMVSATLIYCMLVGDDDEYNQLDDQTKLRNFMIPGTKIMLPMNTSAAYFFKAIPEMIYNKVMKESTQTPIDNRRLRRALAEAARDMLLGPEPIPAAGKPFIEIGLNHSFFSGREITPSGMKDLEPAEQYTMTTSEFGKMISALTGTEKNRLLNPIEADHLVRSIFGSAGAMAQWASNVMGQAAGVRPDVQAKEYPLIGAFLRPEVPRGREDLFYDLKGEIDQAYKTMTIKAERLKDEELDKYLNANEDLIAMHDYVNEVDNAFKEINQAIRFYGTAVDKTITPSERRKEINDLQKIRGEILEGIEQIRRQAGM
jgi:hypothetical protein